MDPDTGPSGPQATAELLTHICQKGFQAGSLIGLGVALPALALRRRSAGISLASRDFQATAARAMTYSPAVVTLASGATGLGLIYGKPLDTEGIEDRAYRLRYNEGQIRTDRFAQIGTVAGAVGGVLALRGIGSTALSACGGAGFGTALGVLAHILTAQPSAGPNKMIKELS